MTQAFARTQPLPNPVSPPSIRQYYLHQIIAMDPILSDYFKNNSHPNRYQNLAHDLMLDGLRYRTTSDANTRNCCCRTNNVTSVVKQVQNYTQNRNQSPPRIQQNQRMGNIQSPSNSQKKHYNVAYVKHNRFLSPSQKKQLITPKVTQVIPSKSSPLVIYGKPRVKVDNECGCPYHINQEQCVRSIPYGGPCQPTRTPRQLKNTQYQVHVLQKQSPNVYIKQSQTSQIPNQQQNYVPVNQLSRYKSTPDLKIGAEANQDLNKTKKNGKSKLNAQSRSKSKRDTSKQRNNKSNLINGSDQPGTTIYVERIVQVQSRVPGKMRVVKSPKNRIVYDQQDYSQSNNEQSRLVARYYQQPQKNSRSRKQKNNPKQAESKIKFLIERDKMNKALQKNLEKQSKRISELQQMMKQTKKKNKPAIRISSNDIISLSQSSNSQMSMMDTGIIKKFQKKTEKLQQQNLQKKNILQQNRQQGQNRGSSAYFGIKENYQFQNEEDEDCQCSKTFNQDSQINENNPIQDEDSSFSDFDK